MAELQTPFLGQMSSCATDRPPSYREGQNNTMGLEVGVASEHDGREHEQAGRREMDPELKFDEHLVSVEELERRFHIDQHTGLQAHVVSRLQNETPKLNLLPTDVALGHGHIHELVGVLRDGSWIHTRAENLLPGDVISLKGDQCVPADVRIIECEDLWVDQSVLLGKRPPEQRVASTTSVFDELGTNVPYMEALNIAFYGTTIVKGHGKAIVIRTGEDTLLGTIAAKLLQRKQDANKYYDVPLIENMKQFEVVCKDEVLPTAIKRVSALVVEHSDVLKRTVVAASFGVQPPVVVEVEDVVLSNETPSEELEREIALQMMTFSQNNEDAQCFTKALAACRHRVEDQPSNGFATNSSGNRVPPLPPSFPIAAAVVVDPIRDQNSILRFSAQFGINSPRPVATGYRKMRYSTLLHGQISGCDVYVHFDQECGAHVVLLQGPAREILSRCGKVRRNGTMTMSPLETNDLLKLQDMVFDLEGRGQTVMSFAELYLDPTIYPVGVKFDIENFNFPTSNMCYLGSLGLVEKLHPEVVLMGSFARAADVRLLIPTVDIQFPNETIEENDVESIHDSEADADSTDSNRVKYIRKVPVALREASTGEVFELEACVYRSKVLSISNTLSQWRQILTEHAVVIFDGCSPAQTDLLVETLQELGECVGLVASGSANALALSNSDVGFTIPGHDVVDLSEEAADVILGSLTCPRSDAIRLIEVAKKLPGLETPRTQSEPSVTTSKIMMTNLFRESIGIGKALGMIDDELKTCFENALNDHISAANSGRVHPMSPSGLLLPPPSPSKLASSSFRSSDFVSPRGTKGPASFAAISILASETKKSSMEEQELHEHLRNGMTLAIKKSVGWHSVLTNPKPAAQQNKNLPVLDGVAHSESDTRSNQVFQTGESEQNERETPNEEIFNTQFTTAGRLFLNKVKKNRAIQVDRRTKGFQLGMEQKTVIIDSLSKRHYRVLILEPDMQHREDLADSLEHVFEILVASSNERAFVLLAMFKVDLILLRLGCGHDSTPATSTGIAFLNEIKKKFVHIPVSVIVAPTKKTSPDMDKLLLNALNHGACGFFEDTLSINEWIERLQKLLHSLVVAQTELISCGGKISEHYKEDDKIVPVQAIKRVGTAPSYLIRPATSKPDTVSYDQEKMLLELSLDQRKHCLRQRQVICENMSNQNSVLGLERDISSSQSRSKGNHSSLKASASAPLVTHSEKTSFVKAKISPLPSRDEVSKRIYAKPQEIQAKIQKHLYERYHAPKHEALPQDPLLHPCIAIDPQTISPTSGKDLLVSKAYHLFKEKRFEEALQQCNRAIKLQGNNLLKIAYLLGGVLHDVTGQYEKAQQSFRVSLKLDPQLHQARFNLSVTLLKTGNDEAALKEISDALRMDPFNEIYLKNRALIYRRMGEFGLAQSEYSKIDSAPIQASPHTRVLSTSSSVPRAKAVANTATSLLQHQGNLESALSKCNMEDGLFDHLFGKPSEDKFALVCAPKDRTPEMVDKIVARLQSVYFFQDFPRHVLQRVAEHMEYDVVGCGQCFTLGEEHTHNFYVVLGGAISVRRKFGDFTSTVTTHHLTDGMPFGCTGHVISSHCKLIADTSTEVGILWPDAYDLTIRNFCTERNNDIFTFLQQVKAFGLFSTSELGHIVGISERKRFRKGEVILSQGTIPATLFILWKGTCSMYQDFTKPPFSSDAIRRTGAEASTGGDDKPPLPFHRYLAKPNWPLGFQSHGRKIKRRREAIRGRRNAMIEADPNVSMLMKLKAPPVMPETLKLHEKNALITTLTSHALFGESAFLHQDTTLAKCSVVADSIVDVLLFDHGRLQEMDLASEVVDQILLHAPEYLDERQVACQKVQTETWDDYKNLRLLELSKHRWPEAKKRARHGRQSGRGRRNGPQACMMRPTGDGGGWAARSAKNQDGSDEAPTPQLPDSPPAAAMAALAPPSMSSSSSSGLPSLLRLSSEGRRLRRSMHSGATSINEDDLPAYVHGFDISKYRDGRYRFVPASATDSISYTGRVLHHGTRTSRKSKVNTVQFDWSAVSIEINVTRASTVGIRLKGDGNYFNVFVNNEFRCILRASLNATCCDIATDLDWQKEYTITIMKRTEPQMRGAMSTFKVCTFYGFIIEDTAEVLPLRDPPSRRIEFIGDSATSAFGNEGKVSSSRNIFGMKGRMENVYNGYACITARMFDAELHVLAWSGKGVHSNSADWGPNMAALWKNTLASRGGRWDLSSWVPDIVVINLGINDLLPPASSEAEIVGAYAQLLAEVRSYRPDAHIFCMVFDELCLSLEESAVNRSHISLQWQEIVKVAISKLSKVDSKIHYTFIKIDGGLNTGDYATLMHYAVSGHVKIAEQLAGEIAHHAQWTSQQPSSTIPYPQQKKQILMPRESPTRSCSIS